MKLGLKNRQIILTIALGVSIAAILWITLLSRIGNHYRAYLAPFWSYKAILNGDMDVAYEDFANVLLFIPLGCLVRYIFRCRLLYICFSGVIFSLVIETTQYICYLGTFELDDIINNTVGMMIGYYIIWNIRKWHGKCVTTKKIIALATLTAVLVGLVPMFYENLRMDRMRKLAAFNDRADGIKNLLVLNGKNGYAWGCQVFVEINDDGSITISGSSDKRSWRPIGKLILPVGKYTFAGLSGTKKNTVALELECYSEKHKKFIRLTPDIGPIPSCTFTLNKDTPINAYVGVYKGAEGTYIARPVIYKED